MTDKQKQALFELATTVAILAIYWISTQPEWKIHFYKNLLLEKLRVSISGPPDETPLQIRLAMEKLRHDISLWEHEQRNKPGTV